MKLKLYRGTMTDETQNTLGSWYTTSVITAKRYCHNIGYLLIVEIELCEEDEGKYLLTKTVEAKGHSNSWGHFTRSNYETWFYVSPSYLEEHVVSAIAINLSHGYTTEDTAIQA